MEDSGRCFRACGTTLADVTACDVNVSQNIKLKSFISKFFFGDMEFKLMIAAIYKMWSHDVEYFLVFICFFRVRILSDRILESS